MTSPHQLETNQLGTNQLLEQIYVSRQSIIYRALKTDTQKRVIIKYANTELPNEDQIALVEREYGLLSELKMDGIPKVIGLERVDATMLLLMEDEKDTRSLKELIDNKEITIVKGLRYAVELAAILAKIHEKQVIHQDIKPHNIVINSQLERVTIIDFGIARRKAELTAKNNDMTAIVGTLAYISPEQTGRINRAIDERTDLYNLGITLYETFTGSLPFKANDTLEWIHCHLALAPSSPDEVNPDIPVTLSNIIKKLIAKDPDERYQSAIGLVHDLKECLRKLELHGAIADFELGTKDTVRSIKIPKTLYGFSDQMGTLNDAVETINDEKNKVVIISGPAGSGKTALIEDWREQAFLKNYQFVAIKFEAGYQSTPYKTLVTALSGHISRLLMESEENLASLKKSILEKVGGNGRLICELIPEVEIIIGAQPELPVLAAQEAQNRFLITFSRFLSALTSKSSPLILVLDDFHEADKTSIELIKKLMEGYLANSMMMICLIREQDAENETPLLYSKHLTLPANVEFIKLKPLDLTTVKAVVSGTLSRDDVATDQLVKTILDKTGGNGAFIKEMLRKLSGDKIIYFDEESGKWDWNISAIATVDVCNDVIELMLRKLDTLPEPTRELLKKAAVIGNEFSIPLLSQLAGSDADTVEKLLEPACYEGLLYSIKPAAAPRGEGSRPNPGAESELAAKMTFAHHRICVTIYHSIAADIAKKLHYQVGRLCFFKDGKTPPAADSNYMSLAFHWNLAGAEVATTADTLLLCQCNYLAALKAKAAFSYVDAGAYCEKAISRLRPDSWKTHYELTLGLHNEAVESSQVTGDLDRMFQYAASIERNVVSIIDYVRAAETVIQAEITAHKPADAMRRALVILDKLGIKLPKKANLVHVAVALLKTRLKLTERRSKNIASRPLMKDPRYLAAMRILSRAASAAYIADQNTFAVVVFKTIELSLRFGNAPASAFAYATYGLLQCGVVGDINYGYQFGKVSLDLVDKLKAQYLTANINVVCGFIRGWKERVEATLEALLASYHKGLEYGDLEFSAYAAFMYCNHAYCAGMNLIQLEDHMRQTDDWIKQIKQDSAFYMNAVYHQTVLNLMGKNSDPCMMVGEVYDENKMVEAHKKSNEISILSVFYLEKLILNYTFGNYLAAYHAIHKGRKVIDGMQGTYGIPAFHFFESLTRLAVLAHTRRTLWSRIRNHVRIGINQFQMKRWSRHAPYNYLHKWYLVEAVRKQSTRKVAEVQRLFEKAIDAAKDSGMIQEEALAYELAAKHYLKENKKTIAQAYMTRAWFLYKQWGAFAKSQKIEQEYPSLVRQRGSENVVNNAHQTTGTVTGYTTTTTTTMPRETHVHKTASSALDVQSIFKAAQIISSETKIDSLLDKVMRTISENIGAQKCVLLLNENRNDLMMRAKFVVEGEQFTLFTPDQYKNYDEVPIGIVNLVARTKKYQISFDACHDKKFNNEPYVSKCLPKSIICSPIVRQGDLIGVIYAENSAVAGVFTMKHIETVQILASQAAVAIDNATLYLNLEKKVEERTLRLKEKTNSINAMLQNLQQGLFMVVTGNMIHPEYSNYLETIFERDKIQFLSVKELLFDNSDLSEDKIQQALSALDASIREPDIAYACNDHLLVSEVCKRFDGGRTKILELSWSPIVNDDGMVEQVMVAVRDVTQLRELKKQAEKQQRELNMMSQILDVNEFQFLNLIEDAKGYLASSRKILDTGAQKPREPLIGELYRYMHTIKGNARSLGFVMISEVAHEVETVYQTQKAAAEPFNAELIRTKWQELEDTLNEYHTIFTDKLRRGRSAENKLPVDTDVLDWMNSLKDSLEHKKISTEEAQQLFQTLMRAVKSVRLEEILNEPISGARRVADRLDKPQPSITLAGSGIRICSSIASSLRDVSMHILTNAVSHGIETSAERLSAQKTAAGQISIQVEKRAHEFAFIFKDDGKGLDLVGLQKKGAAFGLQGPADIKQDPLAIANLIFLSGLSTAEKVSEVSGRGVGMDAVKDMAQNMGGTIKLTLLEAPRDDGRVAFALELVIPEQYVIATDAITSRIGTAKNVA
jgi:predicted ATPase/GAF domain-containing protein/tRNA A-37 threonylcarbamoyl transferase component Bud32/HPt (histidine-containing phosphotransfer) domain-containing protein